MNTTGGEAKIGVFIWGSCVSRDTFTYLPKDRFTLVRYVARQSAISAAAPPVTSVEPPQLASAFQTRTMRGDFASSLLRELSAPADDVDLLLVDLTDERLGVYVLPDGTIITRSNELIASGAEKDLPEGTQHLAFGSDEHFVQWRDAIAEFGRSIREIAPRARIILLDIPWAAHSDSGAPTPASYGLTAEDGNRLMRRYAEAVPASLGATAVSLADHEVTSSPEHKWGEAPFHYSSTVYGTVAQSIASASTDM